MLTEITIFNFGTLEAIDLSLLIRKVKFLWGWAYQMLGRKKLTNWTKTGKCSVSQGFEGGYLSLAPE